MLLTEWQANKRRRHNNTEFGDKEQTLEEVEEKMRVATTLYVGNLFESPPCDANSSRADRSRSFYTSEEQVYELFSKFVGRLPNRINSRLTHPAESEKSNASSWASTASRRPRAASVLWNTTHIKMLWTA